MKNIFKFIFTLLGSIFVFSACSGDTYADKIANEKIAINRFIDTMGIVVTSKFPVDTVFPEKLYYKDPETEIYIRVLKKGNGPIAKETDGTKVIVRFANACFFKTSDLKASNMGEGTSQHYLEFEYGKTATYTDTYSSIGMSFLSPACAYALKHVASGGEVSMIVPSSSGSYMQSNNKEPIYYERMRLTY